MKTYILAIVIAFTALPLLLSGNVTAKAVDKNLKFMDTEIPGATHLARRGDGGHRAGRGGGGHHAGGKHHRRHGRHHRDRHHTSFYLGLPFLNGLYYDDRRHRYNNCRVYYHGSHYFGEIRGSRCYFRYNDRWMSRSRYLKGRF